MITNDMIQTIFDDLGVDNLSVFDIEVFKYDWLVCIYDLKAEHLYMFWDADIENLRTYLTETEDILVGFNIKHYDNPVITAMMNGYDTITIKSISDRIIVDKEQPFGIEECSGFPLYESCDLADDTQLGFSLKGFEAHLGENIVESKVDFDIDRKLTPEEKKEIEDYCFNDILATTRLLYERRGYLATKISIGKRKDITPGKSLSMTNAKLTARYLDAVKKVHTDDYEYVFPDNIKYEYIDEGVIEFFKSIKKGDLEKEDSAKSYTFKVGGCTINVGAGGIHGCIGIYNRKSDDAHAIVNIDVNQFYPSMIVENNYLSRNVSCPEDYKKITVERLEAKKRGDKRTANDLKLINNTTYGAMKNRYNPLYDVKNALSICLSGQLYLLELATHIYRDTGCTLVQLNTDGIMVNIENDKLDTMYAIVKEFEDRTHLSFEYDYIDLIVQKDVNNYLERQTNGKLKVKGGMLVRGIGNVGAFKINNNACIVPKAVQAWFFEGKPVEDTINECDDVFQYQIISKVGATYDGCYHLIGRYGIEEYVPVQKCNRVYATTDSSQGKIYKKKCEKPAMEQIANLPEYCVIDNEGKLTIDDINKSWYIEEAKRVIDLFTEKSKHEGEKIMATRKEKPTETEVVDVPQRDVSSMNIYGKLINARIDFSKRNVQQSGYNGHADFEYFELKDIVPVANEIFRSYGLIFITTFVGDNAVGILKDYMSGESIEFNVPHVRIAEPAKFRMNEVQALGGETTYLRRYLYQIALDIVVADEVDAQTVDEAPKVKPATKSDKTESKPVTVNKPKAEVKTSKPVTATEREEIKKSVVSSEELCDELVTTKLKQLVWEVVHKDESLKPKMTELMVMTNGFTTCTKKDADAIIDKLNAILEA